MEHHSRSRLNLQVYEEACEWFVECRSGDLDDATRQEFDRWLRKSPEHLSAYLEVAAIWNEGPSLDSQRKWDRAKLVAEATAETDNVVPLADLALRERSCREADVSMASDGVSAGRARTRRPFALAAAIAIFSLGALIWSQAFRVPTYATGVGEQRSIVLADGSTVDLNARSRIKIRYSQQQRIVELLQGQALFRVEKDHVRPFIVASDRTRVRAVGTQFDVYRKRDGTVVTVVEGRVAVLTGAAGVDADANGGASMKQRSAEQAAAIMLSAGEQVTVTDDVAKITARPSVVTATAWTQRQLVFEAASLAQVAEEFNRYNERRLVIEDAELFDFHVSGVFSSTDPASLIRFLRERPQVQVIETESEIRVTRKNLAQR